MCNGCDNHLNIIQKHRFHKDGVTRYEVPLETLEPYCRHYGLHIVWVEQLHGHEGENPCNHYYKGGIS